MHPLDKPEEVTTGTIPGSVYSFLLDAKKMADPFFRDNESEALHLMQEDYVFDCSFHLEEAISQCKRKFLVCYGLDTLCDIYINGKQAGKADNMHRTWKFEISRYVLPEENTISIVCHSPVKYIQQQDRKKHFGGSLEAMRGFPYLRKAHCMFGWDWGPRLPDAGIWRSICLIGENSSSIKDMTIKQRHRAGQVFVSVAVEQTGNSSIQISLADPEGKTFSLKNKEWFCIQNPQLWWPNGLGSHPLYTVTAELKEDGNAVASASKRIGLRTLYLKRKKDRWGESFCFCVNGVDFFAMGADYIPEDSIFSRMTDERTRCLLTQCIQANFNSIRVWGGGIYPSDGFYDACDELGLVVWQDFMFACANYPFDTEFENNITHEIEDNVKRIRHHASLGLWCGNNEMEMFEAQGGFESNDETRATYIKMYEYLIPHILQELDPVTSYWPASPSSGGSFDKPNDPDRGDVHYWEVWHGNVPFTEFRKYLFRFVSEFGFQSFPDERTVCSFTLPEDRNIFSRIMEMHQRNGSANSKILSYMSKEFLYPHSLPVFIYASQILQAEAIRYGVEHWRRNRGRCMGAIYWQLNDIWPVISWASIDYYGRWKALQYFARRFFAPILLSCEEKGEREVLSCPVDEHEGNIPAMVHLSVANETRHDIGTSIRWYLRDAQSNIVKEGTEKAFVPALSAKWFSKIDFTGIDIYRYHFHYELLQEGKTISASTLFTEPKYYQFQDPHLKIERHGNDIFISAEAYAKYVMVYSTDSDFLLDDNFFDMECGTRQLKIIKGNPSTIQARSAYDIH
jgi:beta-mannosidase